MDRANRRRPGIRHVTSIAGLLLLQGCASEVEPVTLTPADFRSTETAQDEGPRIPDLVASDEGTTTFVHETRDDTDEAPVEILVGMPHPADPTDPDADPADGSPLEQPTQTVDALVGQINGEPVYASEILDEIGPRIWAELDLVAVEPAFIGRSASRVQILLDASGLGVITVPDLEPEPLTQWWAKTFSGRLNDNQRRTIVAADIIYANLRQRTTNELVLSEARSRLTTQQRQGLIYFLEQIRGMIVREEGGGSEARADERLMEETGVSLNEAVQDRLDREIITNEIRTRVSPRVQVPWRRVRLQYQRDFDLFNPPAIALLRMIFVRADNADNIAAVNDLIASGEQFETIARSELNRSNRAGGGLLDPVEFRGEFEEATVFGPEDLNDATRMLDVGGIAGPLEAGRNVVWIYLESINRPKGRSLYDAQLLIYDQLTDAKFESEWRRYSNRIMSEGSYSDLTEMTRRLVRLAKGRYFVDEPGS